MNLESRKGQQVTLLKRVLKASLIEMVFEQTKAVKKLSFDIRVQQVPRRENNWHPKAGMQQE